MGLVAFLTTEANAVIAPIPQGNAGLPSREPAVAGWRSGLAEGLGDYPSVQIGEEWLPR